ncbi:hypothetical protein ACFL0L_05165 [Patescibacteria group bacterium]
MNDLPTTIQDLFKHISRREWRFVGIIVFVIIVVTLAPYLYGFFSTPEGMNYSGIHHLTPGDTNVYLSTISSVKEGENSMLNLYTGEEQTIRYINPLWYSVGLFAKVLDLPALTAFHISRILLAAACIVILYLFISLLTASVRVRKLALCIVVFASGLGALFNPFLHDASNLLERPIDIWVPEGIPFLSLYHSPHLIASTLLIVLVFGLMALAFRSGRFSYAIWAGVAGALLTWFHPFNTPTIVFVVGVYLIVAMIMKRKFLGKWVAQYILFGILLIPAVVYLFAVRELDPTIASWTQQNVLPSPSPVMYLIAFAFLIPFVIYTLFKKKIRSERTYRFLLVWIIVSTILIYFPVDFQRRMVEGLFIPLGIITAMGIIYLWDTYTQTRNTFIKQSVLGIALVVFLPITNIQILGQDIYIYESKKELPYYIPADEMEAMQWLHNETASDEIILSGEYMGNFIPAYTLRRVYIGHGPQTLDLERKSKEVNNFYGGRYSDTQIQNLLSQENISYIFTSSSELAYGSVDLSAKEYLALVFSNQSVEIYKVDL